MIKEELTKLLMEAYERGQSDLIKSCQETVSIAIDTAILAEREACAKVCEDSVEYAGDTLAEAIRARVNVATNATSQERVDETAKLRHDVLEEVAKEFDKMPFGDTAASFAQFVRNMKR